MTAIANSDAYLKRLLELPRPGEEKILAFYEHRAGLICKDPRLMLLPLDDHLVHRGDGIFETIKYSGGRMYLLDEHLERLKASASGIRLTPPISWEEIRALILEVASAGEEPDGGIRILLGRGPGGFGISPREAPQSSLYIVAYRYTQPDEDWYVKGLSACRSSIPPKQEYLAKLKSANYLPNVLMAMEAEERGADVPFCFDDAGYLTESAVASVCLVEETGALILPGHPNALPSTTLERALKLASDEKLIVGTRGVGNRIIDKAAAKASDKLFVVRMPIHEERIRLAQEVLLFGTGTDCAPVTYYEGSAINATGKQGQICVFFRGLIARDIFNYGVPIPGLPLAELPDHLKDQVKK